MTESEAVVSSNGTLVGRRMSRAGCARTPAPSSEAARNRMRATGQRDTAAELAIRSAVHRRGLRYRVDCVVLPGVRRRADMVFVSARVAVFIDGCFWHGCPIHGTWPKANARFWREKIRTNQARDAHTNLHLAESGWTVIRVWEHENAEHAAERIVEMVRRAEKRLSGSRYLRSHSRTSSPGLSLGMPARTVDSVPASG
jgi:DNA mismatch endonuclease (patch repair protein)